MSNESFHFCAGKRTLKMARPETKRSVSKLWCCDEYSNPVFPKGIFPSQIKRKLLLFIHKGLTITFKIDIILD